MLAFLPALERAAAQSAALEAEVRLADLLPERPTALPHELLPGPTVDHAEGCPDPTRVEVTHPSAGRHSAGTVVRCSGCGASRLVFAPPPEAEDEVAAAPGPALMRRPEAGDYPPATDAWPTA